MVEQVLPNIYRIAVPLADSPLQSINVYIIRGEERHLVIDTGMDREECENILRKAFNLLDINIGKTDFFITHLHVDHLELVFKIASGTSSIFFNRPDAAILDDDKAWEEAIEFAVQNGFPEAEIRASIRLFAGSILTLKNRVKFTLVKEGDIIKADNYELKCVETPGHTPGSMCLYESKTKILFSGDHLLENITPNISLLRERELNPLKSYLESLDKISVLNAKLILPGHGDVFINPQRRIDELKKHHRSREEEILSILRKGPGTAYTVASQLRWEVTFHSWHEFPVFQRWFAAGETLAHLKYLESRGLIARFKQGGKVIFSV